jgi:C1A family cysteine protease
MKLFRRSIDKEKGESEGGRKAARSTLGVFVVLGVLVLSVAVVAQSPFITPDVVNNHSLNESTTEASTEVEANGSSLPEDVNASVDADENTTASNTTVTVEQLEEIEEPQQGILNSQSYNYTVAENWITILTEEERQSLYGYKPLAQPPEPFPENFDFKFAVEGGVGQPPVGQPLAYDAMASGYVTPIRNQGQCGACWIFAATTDFESDVLIKETVSNLTLNYSEQEVGDCNIWHRAGGYSLCNGGNSQMTTNFFTKNGSANESCHPYAAAPGTCQNCSIHRNADNWRIITGYNGNDLGNVPVIQNAILNYGPVYSTIYAGGPGFSGYYSGVYDYWGPEDVNHAIQIIGWDNSLPHSHGTGAWLIKNSWGTGWGAGHKYPGCAWVAYGAANIGDWTSAIADYKNPSDTILYHDESGWMNWCLGYINPTAYGAVRFTPSQNLTLTAVDFWAVDASMTYEIKLFDTRNDLGGGNYSFSNQLGTTQTGTTNEAGYYSIPLNTPVQLVSGNDFIVQVNLTTTGYGYPLPIDYYDAGSHPWTPPLPQVFTFSGESYCSPDGSQFVKPTEDLGIRARLGESPEGITPFLIYGWVTGTTGQPLNGPNVTVKNLNTTEEYTVETNASYNYYQVITSSCNISAGDVLRFNASDNGNSTNCTVTVTQENITDGGLFEQNFSLQKGMCGDVDGSERVDMADYFLLVDYIAEIPGRTLESEWAGDVDCSDKVDMADYFLLVDYIAEIPGRDLNCC